MAHPLPVDPKNVERDAALRFLFDRIDYERSGAMPYDPERLGLDRMQRLIDRLGNPQRGLPIVHVAGTKGKGSTSAMIAAMLSAAGYRTGLYTSPHLEGIEERMAIDGRPCPADELVELVRLVRPAVEAMDAEKGPGAGGQGSEVQDIPHPSSLLSPPSTLLPTPHSSHPTPHTLSPTYFEITTAMALLCFARAKADVAVLEVGLGGRLDATNICTPLVSVITSISFDHTQQLGTTLASIAAEKAGIVKPGVPVVSGVVADEPRETIRRICRERGSRLIELGVNFDFDYEPPRHLERAPAPGQLHFHLPLPPSPFSSPAFPLSLPGRHQAANAAVALATIAELQRIGWAISDEMIRHGLAGLAWPARVEVVARRPAVVLDAAHNVASIEALLTALDESFSASRRLLVFATTQDKDHRGMLARLLGKFDKVFVTRYLNNPRGVPPEQLDALAFELTGRHYPVYPEPADAWDAVYQMAAPDDLVCITGSFFIAAEMRRQLAARPLGRRDSRFEN